MIPRAAEVLRKKDLYDFLTFISDNSESITNLKSVNTFQDLEPLLPYLLEMKPSATVAQVISTYYSLAGNLTEFSAFAPKLLSICQETKSQSTYYNLMGAHSIRNRQFREGIRFYEQSLLYEANAENRNSIFLRIAFALYNLGSLQALHYITIIKSGNKNFLGQIALIDGLVHWDIQKKLGKSIQSFRNAWNLFEEADDPFLKTLASVYLVNVCKVFGDYEAAERHEAEVVTFFADYEIISINQENKQEHLLHTESFLQLDDPSLSLFKTVGKVPLYELEKKYIQFVLNSSRNLDHACKTLGIDRKTLYNKRKSWDMI